MRKEKNRGFALDYRSNSRDHVAAGNGDFVHFGRFRAHSVGARDRSSSDSRYPGPKTSLIPGSTQKSSNT